MLSAKQQPSNIKHGGAIRPNVCKLTFGPLCTLIFFFYLKIQLIIIYINQALHFSHAKLQ